MFTQRDDYSETDRASAIHALEVMLDTQTARHASLRALAPRDAVGVVGVADTHIVPLDVFLASTL